MVRGIRHRGPDRAFRRAPGRCRPGAGGGQPRIRRGAWRGEWRELFPGPLLHRAAAAREERHGGRAPRRYRWRPTCSARCGSPRRSSCPSSPRTRCSSSARTISGRTKRACASPRATCSPTSGVPAATRPEQYFKTQAEMAALFKDLPQALANSVEIAKRCNLALELGKTQLPRFPTPNNVGLDEYLRESAAAGTGAAHARSSIPTTRRARSARRATASGSSSSSIRSCRWVSRAISSSSPTSSTGRRGTACRWGRDAARAPARSSPTASASPSSIRCATICCSSASSIPSASRCRISTSISARTDATASSST